MSTHSLAGQVCFDDETGLAHSFIELSDNYSTQLEMFDQEEFVKYHAGEDSKITDDQSLPIPAHANSFDHVTLAFTKETWSYKVISREMWEIICQREMHWENASDDGAIEDVAEMLRGFRATATPCDPLFDSQERMCVFSGNVSSNISDCLQHSLHVRFLGAWHEVVATCDCLPEKMID
tara:strand:- start:381 stop:917 length:537 start_codon:yes stop_codon:yes gene_type:complete